MIRGRLNDTRRKRDAPRSTPQPPASARQRSGGPRAGLCGTEGCGPVGDAQLPGGEGMLGLQLCLGSGALGAVLGGSRRRSSRFLRPGYPVGCARFRERTFFIGEVRSLTPWP